MDQAAGSAAKSRRDSQSSSPFSLSLSSSVPFSLTPTEMWIDGDPSGDSFISCAPPFAPLKEKETNKAEFERWDERDQTSKQKMEYTCVHLTNKLPVRCILTAWPSAYAVIGKEV